MKEKARIRLGDKDRQARELKKGREIFLAHCMTGDREKASEVVTLLIGLGVEPTRIYLNLLIPALASLGIQWQARQISIAEEHLCSEIITAEMTRLKDLAPPPPANGFSAVTTSLNGDFHSLGARIVADFLSWDGWKVHYLGASTPDNDLVKFVKDRQCDLVVLSLSSSDLIAAARATTSQLKDLKPAPIVMLGGAGLNGLSKSERDSLADACPDSLDQVVFDARRLINKDDPQQSLEVLARKIGKCVRAKRLEKSISQEQLSKLCKLDRTYLSSVENGKHNMTIGALMQIANALRVPFISLLGTETYSDQGQ